MQPLSPILNVMITAVRKAERNLVRDFGEVERLQVSKKGPGDFVSNADRRAEETIIEHLMMARPDYQILAEESGSNYGAKEGEYRFVLDPLDGTSNFLHGFHYWAISLGLEKNGELIAGVVSSPVINEVYHAEKSQGAYLNNRRIRVSNRPKIADAYIACGSPSMIRRQTQSAFDVIDVVNKISRKVTSVRCTGSAALDLCNIAAGRFDGLIELGLKKWDTSAGAVILKEAGGKITGISGNDDYYESGDIVASNYHLHDDLIRLLSSAN